MHPCVRIVVAHLAAVALLVASSPGSSASSLGPRVKVGAYYPGTGVTNPRADLSVRVAGLWRGASRGLADPEPGDGSRFDTWAGYAVDRFPEAVATGDFDQDGTPDVAYARSDFFGQGMTVQLNLGDGTMSAPSSYPATEESTDIKSGDLDGDGDLDLAVVSIGSGLDNSVIDLYLNDGHGAFTHRTDRGGEGPQKMVLADLDGDTDLDLAMSSSYFSDVMTVLLNEGDGTFGPERTYVVGENPKGIAAADLDDDGDTDLAVARDDPATIKTKVGLWMNDGAGTFTRVKEVTSVQQGDPSLVADDFNLDGLPDLAIGLVGTDRQVVMLNQGDLAFTQTTYTTGFSAWDLVSGDLDEDGDPDVVLATIGSSATGDMSVLRNRGDGTFKALRFQAGHNPRDAAIADFDGDTRPDVAVANGSTETGGIHLQRRGLRFGPPALVRTPFPVGSVEPSDVDRDGDLDLVMSTGDPFAGSGFVQVMTNNGSGVFQRGQVLDSGLTSRGGIGHVQPADINGDGWEDLVWTINQFNEPVAPLVTSLNDGQGVFGPAVLTVGTDANTYAGIGDVDNDGDVDLVVSQFTERMAVYPNLGDGTFGSWRFVPVAEFPGMVITEDVDGDGWLDLATTHNGVYGSSKAISVVPGTGEGAFGPFRKYTVGQGPLEIVSTDLDEDGDPDLATSNTGGDDIAVLEDESTTVLLNNGDGTFGGGITTYPGEAINYYLSESAISVADLDADGNVDVVVSNVIGNNAGVYYGHGDGTLEPQQIRYGLQNGAGDLAVADFTGDGLPDIAASGYLQSVDPLFPPTGIVLLRNQGA